MSIRTKLRVNAYAYLVLGSVLIFNEMEARGLSRSHGAPEIVTKLSIDNGNGTRKTLGTR